MFVLLSSIALAVSLEEEFQLSTGESVTLIDGNKEIKFLLKDISSPTGQPEIGDIQEDYIAKFTVFYANEKYEIGPWLNKDLPRNFGQYKANFISFDGSETGTFRIEKLVYDVDEIFQDFNYENYNQGVIEVYFQPDIILEEAVEVVESLGLEIVMSSSCPGGTVSYNIATGEETVTPGPECDEEDLYHWSTTSLTKGIYVEVSVPVGQEKHFAEEFMNNDEVIFAQTSAKAIPETASISKEKEEPIVIKDDTRTKEIGFFQKLINWFKNLF
jgi:hypothetical protein